MMSALGDEPRDDFTHPRKHYVVSSTAFAAHIVFPFWTEVPELFFGQRHLESAFKSPAFNFIEYDFAVRCAGWIVAQPSPSRECYRRFHIHRHPMPARQFFHHFHIQIRT